MYGDHVLRQGWQMCQKYGCCSSLQEAYPEEHFSVNNRPPGNCKFAVLRWLEVMASQNLPLPHEAGVEV